MRVIYIDTLFFLNLTVDYFLLLLTAKVSGRYAGRGQLLAGGLVGAILSVLLYFPPLPPATAVLFRVAACSATVLAAFSKEPARDWPRLCGVFLLLTLVLAGVVLVLSQKTDRTMLQNGVIYFEISGIVMLISFTTIYGLSALVLGKGRGAVGRSYQDITAEMGGHTVGFRALTDSGNLLRDPISGRRVIVVECGVLAPLLGYTPDSLLEELRQEKPQALLEELRQRCGTAFWLLPAHTVTQDTLMVVFRPEKLYMEGKERTDCLLGLTAASLEIGGDCRALTGV